MLLSELLTKGITRDSQVDCGGCAVDRFVTIGGLRMSEDEDRDTWVRWDMKCPRCGKNWVFVQLEENKILLDIYENQHEILSVKEILCDECMIAAHQQKSPILQIEQKGGCEISTQTKLKQWCCSNGRRFFSSLTWESNIEDWKNGRLVLSLEDDGCCGSFIQNARFCPSCGKELQIEFIDHEFVKTQKQKTKTYEVYEIKERAA